MAPPLGPACGSDSDSDHISASFGIAYPIPSDAKLRAIKQRVDSAAKQSAVLSVCDCGNGSSPCREESGAYGAALAARVGPAVLASTNSKQKR
jgi:hypothetical protein